MIHPCIGVSCNPKLSDEENQEHYRFYLEAIEAAGGIPKLISSLEAWARLHPQLDGLLIPGGCDVQPSYYREEAHPRLEQCNQELDELDVTLIRQALDEDIPLLGVCRGMQLINIVLGGTLYQDLADQRPGSLDHRVRDEPHCHRVYVQESSRMAELLGSTTFWVNSRHHQAIKDLGVGVSISGHAEDGVVELLEVAGHRLVIGAQCHPENIHADVPECARLFSALVEESARTMTGSHS